LQHWREKNRNLEGTIKTLSFSGRGGKKKRMRLAVEGVGLIPRETPGE